MYVPGGKLTVILLLAGVVGLNVVEQSSPIGQEPMNMGPSLSTSRANWCVVSMLVSLVMTVSPCTTLIVGFDEVETFQPEAEPIRVTVLFEPRTPGTKCRVGGINRMASPSSIRAEATSNDCFTAVMTIILHR